MQLRADQLQAHLAQPLASLYVLHGDELLTIEAADAIRAAAARKQGFDEREVLVVTANFKWDELTLATGNMSLFGGNKLIDLRIPSGKPGRDGGEALQKHAAHPAQGVVTLVTLPELDWQAKKAAWLTALAEAGVMLELNSPTLHQLPDWIAQRLARQKQSAPREALEFIAAQVEGNLLAAHQEIRKLGLLYPEGALTLAQVEEAVLSVARYNVDTLKSAVLSGDAKRCARTLEGLRAEDTPAPLVLWALASEARILAGVRSAMDRGINVDAALKNQNVFGPRQAAYRSATQRISAGAARNALLHAARIDRQIKGLAAGDLWTNSCNWLCALRAEFMALNKPPSPRFLWSHPAHLIAGGFGSGYSPFMPGTTGTLFAWASFWLLLPMTSNWLWMSFFLLVVFVIGIWARQCTGRDMGVLDHGSMVWDEIVPFWGVLWFTVVATPGDWLWQTAAFVLFRFFDIVKPQPARYCDTHFKGGFGVMADDLVAALYTVLVLWLATVAPL